MIEDVLAIMLFISVILNIILLSNIHDLEDKIKRYEFNRRINRLCDSHD